MKLNRESKIFIAGHNGMVGSAIVRLLLKRGFTNLLTASRNHLDLLDFSAVQLFFEVNKPEYVILAAAKLGGIQANIDNPGVFLYENLVIQNNVIHQSYLHGVQKLSFFGSSCIYPKECAQPMKEEYMLTGPLEPTNEGYALAKIAGIKMLEGYHRQYGFNSLRLMPCNLYGPNDSFDLRHSHVLSALVKRFSDAVATKQKEIVLWGTGIARREFMHVDDLAEATVFMIDNFQSPEFINIGWGEDISIKELAEMIAAKVGFQGNILWDTTKPDGMLRKCMDVGRMRSHGFAPTITLSDGINQMIEIYLRLRS